MAINVVLKRIVEREFQGYRCDHCGSEYVESEMYGKEWYGPGIENLRVCFIFEGGPCVKCVDVGKGLKRGKSVR